MLLAIQRVLVLGAMCLSGLSIGACATSFQGEAKFPGGPRGCYDKCEASGLVMSSYVFVGEYSTGCVCALKTTPSSSAGAADARAQSSAATTAAAVAVMRQMERERAQSSAFIQPTPMP